MSKSHYKRSRKEHEKWDHSEESFRISNRICSLRAFCDLQLAQPFLAIGSPMVDFCTCTGTPDQC